MQHLASAALTDLLYDLCLPQYCPSLHLLLQVLPSLVRALHISTTLFNDLCLPQ